MRMIANDKKNFLLSTMVQATLYTFYANPFFAIWTNCLEKLYYVIYPNSTVDGYNLSDVL